MTKANSEWSVLSLFVCFFNGERHLENCVFFVLTLSGTAVTDSGDLIMSSGYMKGLIAGIVIQNVLSVILEQRTMSQTVTDIVCMFAFLIKNMSAVISGSFFFPNPICSTGFDSGCSEP